VLEKAMSVLALLVVLRLQVLDERAIGDDTCLLETVHAADDFAVDVAIFVEEFFQVVLVDDALRNGGAVNAHVLRVVETVAQIKVGEIEAGSLSIVSGQDLVDTNLESGKVGSACAGFAWVLEKVAAAGESNAMWEILLWTVSGDDAQVGDLSAFRDFAFRDETKSVASCWLFGR